jgi:hypothetical protein
MNIGPKVMASLELTCSSPRHQPAATGLAVGPTHGLAELIVGNIPPKPHWTRDLAVSRDGKRLFLAVGRVQSRAMKSLMT